MRKAVVVCLALVALALAQEKWASYTSPTLQAPPASRYGFLPEPKPSGELDFQSLDTIKYDDNVAATAWIWYHAGNGWGMKFKRPGDGITLAGALINLWPNTWPVPGGNRLLVGVFQADGPEGGPGTQLWMSDTIVGTRGAWNYIPINTAIVDYDFFIFYIQADSYPDCPGMSIDTRTNAPSGASWALQEGSFMPDIRNGDWLIRPVFDWSPQANNLAAMIFSDMPLDTTPGININIRATVKNFGTQTQTPGVPVKLRITGPQGYVREWNNDTTAGTMPYRGTNVVTFRPTWRTPDTAGLYELKVWTELAGDEFRGNDTMVRLMNIAKWYSYADWNSTRIWISAAGPEKAVQFHPPDFRVNYPVEISRVRSYFYLHPQLPWDDSIFTYAIYGDDGSTLLWQSDTLRAAPNQAKDCAVEPPVLIESGDFFLATVPRSGSGRPTNTSDTLQQAHSFYGSGSTGWLPWTLGEWQFAVSFKTRISGIAEGSTSILPSVRVSSASNPTARPVIHWQIPKATPVAITLYDATGRAARTYQVNPSAQVLSGSLKLDTKGIARGIYLVRLTAGGSRADAKLVLSD